MYILGLTDKRIDDVLQIVRLTETGKKRAGQFSLGMKQRLGIAVALLNDPKLLILDEPTNGLDPIGIEELRELIRSFPAKGITVILSSHILSEVQQIADHTVFDFKDTEQSMGGKFEINPENATQLLCDGIIYQVTSDTVSNDELGSWIDIIAESVTFDTETKRPLSKEDLNKIDWDGKNAGQGREQWFYTDVYEIYGTDKTEAVAVKINNRYYIAEQK